MHKMRAAGLFVSEYTTLRKKIEVFPWRNHNIIPSQ